MSIFYDRAVFEKSWPVLARGGNGSWALARSSRPRISVIRCSHVLSRICITADCIVRPLISVPRMLSVLNGSSRAVTLKITSIHAAESRLSENRYLMIVEPDIQRHCVSRENDEDFRGFCQTSRPMKSPSQFTGRTNRPESETAVKPGPGSESFERRCHGPASRIV